ncbi:hypothetical protein [Phormidesmis priestleyi]|uniref:hypothetical protein n=1 Tax=Phormidesmis priestleyi TaxID=268141 RepID=UPI0015E6F232|nr:hypothetical protein [Phormidesmis priestleyi]
MPAFCAINDHSNGKLQLEAGTYTEVGTFRGSDRVQSPIFSELQLTARSLFTGR